MNHRRIIMNDVYKTVEMPNGITMLSILPINETGIAEAYCTIRNNEMGNSKNECGPFSCNIYKKFGLENGIKDFLLCCDALSVDSSSVVTNRLTAFTNIVRDVDEDSLIGYDIFDEPNAPRADGLITNSSYVTLYLYAADCAICFFLDPKKKVCGCLHASWKGSLLGIFEAEIDKFCDKYKSSTNDIIAVLAPSIGYDAFEVGAECADQFINKGFSKYVDYKTNEKLHVNLPEVNKQILLNCGLKKENVYVIDDLCTFKDDYYFHSYRRGPISKEGLHLNGMNGYFIKLK